MKCLIWCEVAIFSNEVGGFFSFVKLDFFFEILVLMDKVNINGDPSVSPEL